MESRVQPRCMRRASALVLAAILLLLHGCTAFDTPAQAARPDDACILEGTLAADTADTEQEGAWIVAALQHSESRNIVPPIPVDHMPVQRGAQWSFALEPGHFSVLAFRDLDGDRALGPGEPFHHVGTDSPLRCARHDRLTGIALSPDAASAMGAPPSVSLQPRVQAHAREAEWARGFRRFLSFGDVVSLSDARFASDVSRGGMWRPNDFLVAGHAGIYFTEPYDPERIPVVFIHGVGGSPRIFSELVAALDRERFQPWFYFYPSGVRLPRAAALLAQAMRELEARHEPRRVHIVAHSMGGLVGQTYLAQRARVPEDSSARALITLSTPWGGHAAAQRGLDRSPVVLPVWRDLAPSSDFLKGLFDQQASIARGGTELHMLFGYRGTGGTDGVVTLSSMLRGEALQHAHTVRAFDNTHKGMLHDERVIDAVVERLEREVKSRDGRVEVVQ